MKKTLIIFLFFIFTELHSASVPINLNESKNNVLIDFPTPPNNGKLLFYIQRTLNKNTIIYELNFNSDGTLNTNEPIHPSWLRYEEGGKKQDLSYIQRKFAYGLEYIALNKQKTDFKIYFVCYKKIYIHLMKYQGNNYSAFALVNNTFMEIKKIFVNIEGGTMWVPTIKYIDVTGIETASGKYITHRIAV